MLQRRAPPSTTEQWRSVTGVAAEAAADAALAVVEAVRWDVGRAVGKVAREARQARGRWRHATRCRRARWRCRQAGLAPRVHAGLFKQ